jgi:hypothetical protein
MGSGLNGRVFQLGEVALFGQNDTGFSLAASRTNRQSEQDILCDICLLYKRASSHMPFVA